MNDAIDKTDQAIKNRVEIVQRFGDAIDSGVQHHLADYRRILQDAGNILCAESCAIPLLFENQNAIKGFVRFEKLEVDQNGPPDALQHVFGAFEGLADLRHQVVELEPHNFLKEFVFRIEVAVDGAFADTRRRRNFVDGGRVKTFFGKDGVGRLQNAIVGRCHF